MTTPVSKITSRFQTVIPKEVRERLALRAGDLLRYHLDEKNVAIKRVPGQMHDNPFVTFSEWAAEADERAYKSL